MIGTMIIHVILLSGLTLGIYAPWAWVRVLRLKSSHTIVNGKQVTFSGTGGQLFILALIHGLLTIITLSIDASDLPSGITLSWVGGVGNQARVLAVYGNLTMTNVSVTGGSSVAEVLPPPDPDDEYGQLSTRAHGAGLAVWGVARLVNCTLHNNHCIRETDVPARSRDAGAFGGGIYADIVDMEKCVVSGNSVSASGVSGGGVFYVGVAGSYETASIVERSSITGNRITGLFAYDGGVYSDGGGIGNRKALELTNCTIAMNFVEPLPDPPFGYWRGGGVYMSNGYLFMHSCTVVENEVYGVPRTDDLGKPQRRRRGFFTVGLSC